MFYLMCDIPDCSCWPPEIRKTNSSSIICFMGTYVISGPRYEKFEIHFIIWLHPSPPFICDYFLSSIFSSLPASVRDNAASSSSKPLEANLIPYFLSFYSGTTSLRYLKAWWALDRGAVCCKNSSPTDIGRFRVDTLPVCKMVPSYFICFCTSWNSLSDPERTQMDVSSSSSTV